MTQQSPDTSPRWTWKEVGDGKRLWPSSSLPTRDVFYEDRMLFGAVGSPYVSARLYDLIPSMCDALNAASRPSPEETRGLHERAALWIPNLHPSVQGLAAHSTQGALIRDLDAALTASEQRAEQAERERDEARGKAWEFLGHLDGLLDSGAPFTEAEVAPLRSRLAKIIAVLTPAAPTQPHGDEE